MAQKTDIEIAQACEMHPITEVAKTAHIPEKAPHTSRILPNPPPNDDMILTISSALSGYRSAKASATACEQL